MVGAESEPASEPSAPEPEAPAGGGGDDAADVKDGKVLAILSYVFPILCIVPLIQKNNAFSLYHAKQVLLLLIAWVALPVVGAIPVVGCVTPFGALALFVFTIMGLVNACQDKAKPLPLVGKFGEDWFKGITKNG